ncbi:hypothetical protein [Salimicrobium halophilum]|uniref:PilX N-terminal n=1 Tax=Salimicrobium halophilum TaxID=86666 RepID=A0A1G8PIW1_9BACI|nr:hypothetical protein [Salimicrobium halophilum]SDI92444.1 hypothetical protein SAMN04490247_0022 [Salimicrobium halophilum]
MNNEKGIALVTVLLTIVVTMLLLGTLASIILSTGAQTQRSQESIQADSLAMMGQEYITSSFESVKDEASSQINENQTVSTIIQQWAGNHSITERSLGEGEYIVTLENTSGAPLTYQYEAKGIVDGQEEIIAGVLSISEKIVESNWEDNIIDEKENLENVLNSEDATNICEKRGKGRGNGNSNGGKIETFEPGDYRIKAESCNGSSSIKDPIFEERSRVWLEDTFIMNGSNTITINGFAFFDLTSLSMNGGNIIKVNGDVFVGTDKFIVDKKTAKATIAIDGNAYFDNPEASVIGDLNICVTGNTNADNIPSCQGG